MQRLLASALAALSLAASAPARAEWAVNADVEHFRWAEATEPGVTESGPMFGIGARYTQDRAAGWNFGWRGRLYFGRVDYNGAFLANNQPATGTTDYTGLANEAQAIYRFGAARGLELVSGLMLDYWNRQLSPDQREQYWIASLRVGLGLDRHLATGWFGGLGIKYPFYTREDAHLQEIGFSSNPRLEPKGAASLYADLGYRVSRQWTVGGYYDSYRFRESEPTPVVSNPFLPGCVSGCTVIQPATNVDRYGLRVEYSF